MKVKVNGEMREVSQDITVSELLNQLGVNPKLCVVERNLALVKKENYATEKLSEGDEIEIVTLVGGG